MVGTSVGAMSAGLMFLYWEHVCNVGKTIINHPFGNGLIPPIYIHLW